MAHSQSESNREETVLLISKADDHHSHVVVDLDRATLNSTNTEAFGLTARSSAEKSKSSEVGGICCGEVEFRVGKDRQLMIGSRNELASISPVFRAMFSESQPKKQTTVEMPDVNTQSFGVILRCAACDDSFQLSEDNVWNVLQAAHQFQVLPVVTRCFLFLLHQHPQRRKSRHLCAVLEKAHQLNYREHHASCLHRVKRHAGKVLKSAAALSELCHQCMLELVSADDLPVPEILVHDAVLSWARAALGTDSTGSAAEPSWEESRAVAGQLVYQVRYLAMPRHVLHGLRAGQPGCLLSEKEKICLLDGEASSFPPHVGTPRQGKVFGGKRLDGLSLWCKERKTPILVGVYCVLVCLFILLVVYLCYPGGVDEAASSKPDSPVYVLVIQEEQQ